MLPSLGLILLSSLSLAFSLDPALEHSPEMQLPLLAALAVVGQTVLANPIATAGLPASLDFLTIGVKGLSEYLANGTVTSVQLVNAYLDRIDRDNHQGLNLRAVIETAPYASVLAIAATLDAERLAGKSRGVWSGIPILVKDNCATDVELGMNTTAGSYALLGSQVPRDAHIVARLRDSGAIILGKAALSEWANYRGGNTNGWSGRGGQVSSAYVLGGYSGLNPPSTYGVGDPSGSSSGSAVAVSAGWAPIAIGTETDGSIISPSNRAALYGLKPTVGLASRAGIVPISSVQDSPGPMGKSAYDVAAMLTIIAGPDPRDVATAKIKSPLNFDYTTAIVKDGFKGLRIGVPFEGFYNSTTTGLDQVVYDSTAAVLAKIASLGATVVNNTNLPSTAELFSPTNMNETVVLDYTFKVDIETYLSELTNSTVHTLADLINYNDKDSVREMPPGECCQEIFVRAVQTTGIDSKVYKAALKADQEIGGKRGLQYVFDHYKLDALAIPSEVSTTPAAIVGWPIATVPIGYYENEGPAAAWGKGQPYGLAFIARPFEEATLIRIMGAFEESFPARRVPEQLRPQ